MAENRNDLTTGSQGTQGGMRGLLKTAGDSWEPGGNGRIVLPAVPCVPCAPRPAPLWSTSLPFAVPPPFSVPSVSSVVKRFRPSEPQPARASSDQPNSTSPCADSPSSPSSPPRRSPRSRPSISRSGTSCAGRSSTGASPARPVHRRRPVDLLPLARTRGGVERRPQARPGRCRRRSDAGGGDGCAHGLDRPDARDRPPLAGRAPRGPQRQRRPLAPANPTTAARGAVSIAHRRITQTNGAELAPQVLARREAGPLRARQQCVRLRDRHRTHASAHRPPQRHGTARRGAARRAAGRARRAAAVPLRGDPRRVAGGFHPARQPARRRVACVADRLDPDRRNASPP